LVCTSRIKAIPDYEMTGKPRQKSPSSRTDSHQAGLAFRSTLCRVMPKALNENQRHLTALVRSALLQTQFLNLARDSVAADTQQIGRFDASTACLGQGLGNQRLLEIPGQ
jgi:hypothetical protein